MTPSSSMRRTSRTIAGAAALALALGCDDPLDDDRCAEGGEFASTGCAELRGTVTRPDGVPIGGALVQVRLPAMDDAEPAPSPTLLGSASMGTNSQGQYRLRVRRFSLPTGTPDTATLRVVVSLRPTASSPAPVELRDVVATFARVGQRPVPTEVPPISIVPPPP